MNPMGVPFGYCGGCRNLAMNCRRDLQCASERRRGHSHGPSESRGEGRWRLETDGKRDLCDTQGRLGEKLAGAVHALRGQPCMRGLAGRVPKSGAEMEAAEADKAGEFIEPDMPFELLAHERRDTPHLPVSKAAPSDGSRRGAK